MFGFFGKKKKKEAEILAEKKAQEQREIEERIAREKAEKEAEEKKAAEKKAKKNNTKKAASEEKPAAVKKAKPVEKKAKVEKAPEVEENETEVVELSADVNEPGISKEEAEVRRQGKKNYHISFRQSDEKWQVKFANGQKAIKLFDTQKEAIDFAKSLAKAQDGTFTIHKTDGKIRKRTYTKKVAKTEDKSEKVEENV